MKEMVDIVFREAASGNGKRLKAGQPLREVAGQDGSAMPIRALVIAEAANPEWVSVPLVGWSHAQAIREICDAHLVTQVRNREAILRAGLVEGRDFTAIDSEAVAARLCKLAGALRGGDDKGYTTGTALGSLAYYYFEHLLWREFGARIKAGEFDVVHRLTPLSPTTPSLLARRCRRAGVPFVLGPINGGVPWPRHFDAARRREKEWLSYVRWMYKILPGYRSTLVNSEAILVGSRDTWRQIPSKFHGKCFYLPENAVDPSRFAVRRAHVATRPVKVCFVGRLVPYKGADMLLEAMAPLVRDGLVTVQIIGNGPMREELETIVRREEIGHGVTLAGWVEHTQVSARLAEMDVLVFPSIREFGGGVVLEAMAVGVVPVVMNYGGPGELVTDHTGFLVEMGPRNEIIRNFRRILLEISGEVGIIERKSAAAVRYVREHFTWQAKAQRTLAAYRWACESAKMRRAE